MMTQCIDAEAEFRFAAVRVATVFFTIPRNQHKTSLAAVYGNTYFMMCDNSTLIIEALPLRRTKITFVVLTVARQIDTMIYDLQGVYWLAAIKPHVSPLE